MNIPAFMLYGDPAELSEYLSSDLGADLSKYDLSAALANALARIATLERGLASPIHGPTVLAALAGYTEALAACDAAPELEHGKAILDRFVAEAALQEAIRAERDGAA